VPVIIFEENDQEGIFKDIVENQMYIKKSIRSYYSSYKKRSAAAIF
jgi:hypothetical protein